MNQRPRLTDKQVRRAQTSVILIGASIFGLSLIFSNDVATSGPHLMVACVGGGLIAAWVIEKLHKVEYGNLTYDDLPSIFYPSTSHSMNRIRAKFVVKHIITEPDGSKTMYAHPVVGGSPENDEFFEATPAGEITLYSTNPNVSFQAGKEYYVDFTPVEQEPTEA